MPYRLNHNFGGKDVLHKDPSEESCNLDDADKVELVDDDTAEALLSIGGARKCEHCMDAD